jgi:hypothetical protein
MNRINDTLQWAGALFVIVGHILNSIGPSVYPYNIVAFTLGTVAFLSWASRVKNSPQIVVNVVSMVTCLIGLVNAWK